MDLVYDPSYDFSNKNIDWEDYDVKLRTDSIWERAKLKDYFRLYYKVFYYNPNNEKYYVSLPQHDNYNQPNNWKFREFTGYDPTGKSTAYEKHHGEHYALTDISVSKTGSLRDKNTLCYLRFRKFKKCEGNSVYKQTNDIYESDSETQCFREMMEMMQFCTPLQLNWISDLWHHFELQSDPSAFGKVHDLNMLSDQFDTDNFKTKSY